MLGLATGEPNPRFDSARQHDAAHPDRLPQAHEFPKKPHELLGPAHGYNERAPRAKDEPYAPHLALGEHAREWLTPEARNARGPSESARRSGTARGSRSPVPSWP